MSTPQQSGLQWVADVQATLESLARDVVNLQEQIGVLGARQEYHEEVISSLIAKDTDLQEQIDSLSSDGSDDGEGPPDPVDPDPGTPVPDPVTDLGINVSHYRFTYGIEPDANSPTGYTVKDKRLTQLYGQYPVVRVMNWTAQTTARSRNTTWLNRITADDFDKWDTPNGSGATGLPIEALIQLANECNTTLMWPFPQQGDRDFMYRAGFLFAQLYKPPMLIVEGPNEVWDSGRGWHYHKQAGGDFGKAMKLYARDCAEKFSDFEAGWKDGGRSPLDLNCYVGGQLHNLGVLSIHILPHLDSGEYDGFVVSGYFGDSKDTPGQYIDNDGGYKHTMKMLDQHAELAKQYGKTMGIYELNSHITWGQDDFDLIDSPDVQTRVGNVVAECRNLQAWPVCVYSGVGYRYAAGDPDANFPIYHPETFMPQSPVVETLGLPTI